MGSNILYHIQPVLAEAIVLGGLGLLATTGNEKKKALHYFVVGPEVLKD